MNAAFLRRCILSILCYGIMSIIFYSHPVNAAEPVNRSGPSRDIKGFWEVNLYTQSASRTVVEEIRPGVNFEGDAESTRVMVKLATRPLRPVEFYLQAGMANLIIDQFNNYRGDYEFAMGGGASLTLYEHPGPEKFKVITRVDFLTFKTTDNVLIEIQSQDTFVRETIRWREYALDGIGVWRSRNWEPFIGARFSWIDAHDTIDHPGIGRLSLKEDVNLGMVLGTNIYFDPRENFAFNAEASLIDQFSLKIGFKLWY